MTEPALNPHDGKEIQLVFHYFEPERLGYFAMVENQGTAQESLIVGLNADIDQLRELRSALDTAIDLYEHDVVVEEDG